MDLITTALGSATTLFGVVETLAVLCAGFFIGRKWLGDAKAVRADDLADIDEGEAHNKEMNDLGL